MQTADAVNGFFELVGSFIQILSVRQLYRDKVVKGVHWAPTLFFAVWSLWNFYFYLHLELWLSFTGSIVMGIINIWWVALMWYYIRKNRTTAFTTMKLNAKDRWRHHNPSKGVAHMGRKDI